MTSDEPICRRRCMRSSLRGEILYTTSVHAANLGSHGGLSITLRLRRARRCRTYRICDHEPLRRGRRDVARDPFVPVLADVMFTGAVSRANVSAAVLGTERKN